MAKRRKDSLLKQFPDGYATSKGRVFPSAEAAAPTARKHRGVMVRPKGTRGVRVQMKKRSKSN